MAEILPTTFRFRQCPRTTGLYILHLRLCPVSSPLTLTPNGTLDTIKIG